MTIDFDTSGFNKMIAGLAAVSGKSQREVLLDQVAQLLSVCIKYTHAASKESIKASVEYKNRSANLKGGGKLSVNKDGENVWLIDGGKKYLASHWRLPEAKWAKALALAEMLESKRINPNVAAKSRGLTKSTWLQIAESLGIGDRVKAPGWVKNATTFKGRKPPKIGSANEMIESASVLIELINASGLLVNGPSLKFRGNRANLNGWSIIQRAMNARAKAFQIEMKKGVFNDLEKRAKRYPGIFTS